MTDWIACRERLSRTNARVQVMWGDPPEIVTAVRIGYLHSWTQGAESIEWKTEDGRHVFGVSHWRPLTDSPVTKGGAA